MSLDLERFPWLALIGRPLAEWRSLVPIIRDKTRAGTDRAARRRLEKEARKLERRTR